MENKTKLDLMYYQSDGNLVAPSQQAGQQNPPKLPKYLQEVYWWAYVHPNAVRFFERQWLVNLILWGNFRKLRDRVLSAVDNTGKSLQVACVYGDFSTQWAQNLEPDAQLDIVDITTVQLENATDKLSQFPNVALFHQDSSNLHFNDNSYDTVVLFFLLHEQPEKVRQRTLKEALRVLKPGGKMVIMDYHKPARLNPFYYIMYPILRTLEPFALDLWRTPVTDWLPEDLAVVEKNTYFGGLYQKLEIIK